MYQLSRLSQLITSLGKQGIHFIRTIGCAFTMLFCAIVKKPEFKRNGPIFIRQIYVLGWQSFFIIAVSGAFIGMVLALQGYLVLVDYGAESRLGQMLAISLLRELGPVVTALLFAGRAGSALTAEIGLMKTTEQLASLEMMAVDPLKRIIAPRFWAGVMVVPMLTIVFISFAIIGGQWVGIAWKGIDSGSFWGSMQAAVTFDYDLGNSMIKSVIFGLIITWISLFNGYFSYPSSEGLSLATTKTVVQASLVVLGCDFILTSWMFGG